MLIVVFTLVTDATNEIALPFNTVCTIFPGVENVTPAEEMIVPVMILQLSSKNIDISYYLDPWKNY